MTLAISAGTLLTPYTRTQSSATGDMAERLARMVRQVVEPDVHRATDWRPVVHAKIEDIAVKCSTADWDGYGALPIDDDSKRTALHLVEILPGDLPAPEVTADPDGEISLFWDFGPHYLFTLSVGGSGIISYAGILGKGVKRHGEEPFRGDVSKILVESIREISQAR
jgi:hypothetical protein